MFTVMEIAEQYSIGFSMDDMFEEEKFHHLLRDTNVSSWVLCMYIILAGQVTHIFAFYLIPGPQLSDYAYKFNQPLLYYMVEFLMWT